MKKLLFFVIIVSLAVPAMAWRPYEGQSLVFANTGARLAQYGGDETPKNYSSVSREGGFYALMRFDEINNLDANEIGTATLWLRSSGIETMPPGGDWGPNPDSNAYCKLMTVDTPWSPNANANIMYSDRGTQTTWANGNFDARLDGSSQDISFHSDFTIDSPLAAIDGPLPEQSAPGEVDDPNTINNRYHAAIDVTDAIKAWADGTLENNGFGVLISSWWDNGSPNIRHGSIQSNWFIGTSRLGGDPPDANGWINFCEDPGYWFWWGTPVNSIFEPGWSPNGLDGPAPHAGDVDRDGDVDIFDFMDLQGGYGAASGAAWTNGDIDPYDGNSLAACGDGDVDIFDFMDIQANWGWKTGGGVPEPATISLLSLGGLAFLRRKVDFARYRGFKI